MAKSRQNQIEFDLDKVSQSLLSDFSTGEAIKRVSPKSGNEEAVNKAPDPPNDASDTKIEKSSVESEAPNVLSVKDLNNQIKSLLEGTFPIVWVKGEISNFKIPPSGHFYFSLKDDKAQIRSVMFKGHSSKLRFTPEDGMEVIVRARVSVYAPRGDYQIICEQMDPVGQGALQIAYDQLKKKLEAEGLFSSERKKQIPILPKRVALITSPTGAAVRDMLNVLSRRFRGLDITVIPTSVQGQKAPKEIVNAIALAQRVKNPYDVIIVGRGGGSIEDLWSFNDEAVARAIASCQIPIVSAVGHEVDFTIADYVADLRAPTPSAGAELITKNKVELQERVVSLAKRHKSSMLMILKNIKQEFISTSKRLIDPKRKLQELIQRNDELVDRLSRAVKRNMTDAGDRLENLRLRLGKPDKHILLTREKTQDLERRAKFAMQAQLNELKESYRSLVALLDSLSPLKVVERGYSIVSKEDKVIKSAESLKEKDKINIRFAKGHALAEVFEIDRGE